MAQITSNDLNFDSRVSKFYEHLFNACELYVPIVNVSPHLFPPWYSPKLIDLVISKKRCHKLWKSNSQLYDYIEFKRLRALCIRTSRQLYKEFIIETESKIKRNSKAFWAYINTIKKRMVSPITCILTTVPPTMVSKPHNFFLSTLPQFT